MWNIRLIFRLAYNVHLAWAGWLKTYMPVTRTNWYISVAEQKISLDYQRLPSRKMWRMPSHSLSERLFGCKRAETILELEKSQPGKNIAFLHTTELAPIETAINNKRWVGDRNFREHESAIMLSPPTSLSSFGLNLMAKCYMTNPIKLFRFDSVQSLSHCLAWSCVKCIPLCTQDWARSLELIKYSNNKKHNPLRAKWVFFKWFGLS